MAVLDIRALALVATTWACGSATGGYDGTVVLGADYAQALVTASGDRGCPPRIQRPGTCVRSDTAPGGCAENPACVSELRVRRVDGTELGVAGSGFVRVPGLAAAEGEVVVELEGCGGRFRQRVELGPPVAAFSAASAQRTRSSIELAWAPDGEADLVCALWTGPGTREVCCSEDVGALSVALRADDTVEAVFLSRGRLLRRVETAAGAVEIYRTAETESLVD